LDWRRHKHSEAYKALLRLPEFKSKVFGRPEFDALLAPYQNVHGISISFRGGAVMLSPQGWGFQPPNACFGRIPQRKGDGGGVKLIQFGGVKLIRPFVQ
jgi:hypothetical protein